MSKKILYLGENSWCYTVGCKRHSEAVKLQKDYESFVRGGDIEGVAQTETLMLALPEAKEALLRMKVQEIRKNLGRAPAIGLDLDGTVADFTHGLREHMGRKYRIPSEEWMDRYPDPDEYEYSEGLKPWFSSREEFMVDFLEAEKQGLYRELRLIDSPHKTLSQLRGYGFNIIGTTARSDIYNHDSLHWLKSRKLPIERIINTGPRKSHITEVDLFVDDSPKVLDELLQNNRAAVVKTQAYNARLELPDSLSRRISKWDEDSTPEEVVNLAFSTTPKKA